MFSNIYHLLSRASHMCHTDWISDSSDLNNAALLSAGIRRLCWLKRFKPAQSERFTKTLIKEMSRCEKPKMQSLEETIPTTNCYCFL